METLARIKRCRFDRIVEKHEGPFDWVWQIDPPPPTKYIANPRPEDFERDLADFLLVDGRNVLLPIGRSHHPNVTILRVISSADDQSMTVFLRDRTHADDPGSEMFSAGFMAVCDRMPGESFYLAHVFHEWFILPPIGG